MRSLDKLITLARERTNNTNYGTRSGISQNLAVQFANDAQDHLQSAIVAQHPQEFTVEQEIQVTSAQETYSIDDNVFGGGKIITIWYSPTGQQRDYYRLKPRTMFERQQQEGNDPLFYIRASGLIYLNPIPRNSSGKIKVSYYRELDWVDVVRGTVNGTPSGAVIAAQNQITPDDIGSTEYLCISDKHGNVMLYNGEISSYASNNITLAANVSTYLVDGYALADLASGKITLGKYSTTHSKLQDICERYLLVYLQKRLLNKQASNSSIVELDELKTIEADILVSFGQPTEDIYQIPVIDSEVMG